MLFNQVRKNNLVGCWYNYKSWKKNYPLRRSSSSPLLCPSHPCNKIMFYVMSDSWSLYSLRYLVSIYVRIQAFKSFTWPYSLPFQFTIIYNRTKSKSLRVRWAVVAKPCCKVNDQTRQFDYLRFADKSSKSSVSKYTRCLKRRNMSWPWERLCFHF